MSLFWGLAARINSEVRHLAGLEYLYRLLTRCIVLIRGSHSFI